MAKRNVTKGTNVGSFLVTLSSQILPEFAYLYTRKPDLVIFINLSCMQNIPVLTCHSLTEMQVLPVRIDLLLGFHACSTQLHWTMTQGVILSIFKQRNQ